jgi:hypothetical protein
MAAAMAAAMAARWSLDDHFDCVDGIDGIIIIIGMPPHMIAVGPMDIMLFIISQRSRIMSIMDALAGFIFIIIPSGIISQVT